MIGIALVFFNFPARGWQVYSPSLKELGFESHCNCVGFLLYVTFANRQEYNLKPRLPGNLPEERRKRLLDEEVVVIGEEKSIKKGNVPPPAKHLRRVHCSLDLEIIMEGDWLVDEHIDAAQALLASQFKDIQGFQTAVALHAGNAGGSMATYGKLFVQLLNINQTHWVTVSKVSVPFNDVARVYDSLGVSVTQNLKQTVAALLYCQESFIEIQHMAVQQQSGSNDCGLFIIANALAPLQ
ncbi:UNVERIFIED_CONTAM: hypothetical protein FKN15_008538 [Acipenser sinensis]